MRLARNLHRDNCEPGHIFSLWVVHFAVAAARALREDPPRSPAAPVPMSRRQRSDCGLSPLWRVTVFSLFLCSGAVGLLLQVVWGRMLTGVFGSTVLAASAVVTAFMLGLALGSAWFGRWVDRTTRPLLLYALLEIGVGLYALSFPTLIALSTPVHVAFFQHAHPGVITLNAFRLAWSLILLLPPTVLMGGTLPVLGRHLAAQSALVGREVGYLYAVNTFGAVAGAALAGFALLERLGVRGTLLVGGSMALLIGAAAAIAAWRFGRVQPGKPASANPKTPLGGPKSPAPGASERFRWMALAFCVSGFCALAYEILWTRVLIFLVGTSVHAFATMLTTFLVGNALGAALSSRFLVPRVSQPLPAFGITQTLVGAAAIGSVLVLGRLPWIEDHFIFSLQIGADWRHIVYGFADAALVMFLPTVLMGAAFPLILAGCSRRADGLGRRIGDLYAANTIGCVLGSLAAGFVLLPLLGTQHSLLLVGCMNLALGAVVVARLSPQPSPARTRTALAALAVGALIAWILPPDLFHQVINAQRQPSELTFVEESTAGTVTVHDLPNGERLIAVNGVDVAGRDFMLRTTQKLQGYLPLLLHPNPRKVAQIGFGSGETTRVGLDFGVEDYTVVEICPAVFRAGKMFEDLNHGSYRDPRVRKIIMDGKNFALLSNEHFDVLMNDSIFPGSSGSSALYGLEHFRNCRNRLAEGGLFSCWVPLDLRPSEMRMILRSFVEVFPHASFWVASNCLNKHGVIVGTTSPLRIDFQRVRALMEHPAIRQDLEPIALDSVYDLLDCHLLDAQAIQELVREDPVTSDDRPRLEFSCARPATWQSRLLGDLAMLAARPSPVLPYVENLAQPDEDQQQLAQRLEATTHIFRGQVAQLAFRPLLRSQEFRSALAAHPEEIHVRTCQEELDREIRDLEDMVRRYPTTASYRDRLAGKYYLALRFAEAREVYESLLRTLPRPEPVVFIHLAEIAFQAGRKDQAEDLLLDGLKSWPGSAEAHDRLAGIYLDKGDLPAALRHVRLALELSPLHPEYLAHHSLIESRYRSR